jgi:hypothetical protein
LPVRLVSVDDVRLPAPAGAERELDAFYVVLLGFEREDVELKRPRPRAEPLLGGARRGATAPPLVLGLRDREQNSSPAPPGAADPWQAPEGPEGPEGPVYRADNFRLRFQTLEPPVVRDGLRAQGIEVPSLAEAEAKLIEAEIEYTWERGLMPGRESLLLQDPAGNWVELVESRVAG